MGFKERSLKFHRSRAVPLPGKREATWGPEGDGEKTADGRQALQEQQNMTHQKAIGPWL